MPQTGALVNRFPDEHASGHVAEAMFDAAIPPRNSSEPVRLALVTLLSGPLPRWIDYFTHAASHAAPLGLQPVMRAPMQSYFICWHPHNWQATMITRILLALLAPHLRQGWTFTSWCRTRPSRRRSRSRSASYAMD